MDIDNGIALLIGLAAGLVAPRLIGWLMALADAADPQRTRRHAERAAAHRAARSD